MSDQLHGTVERVTYHNKETGYSVIRLNAEGRPGLVTVVGNLPEVNPGESLRLEGAWTTHQQYGRQFKAEWCEQVLPATVEGIKKYLGSGLVKGVGPVTAARIAQRFGADTLRVLDEEPRRLREALGVGPKRAAAIAKSWEEQKQIREVMLFLQSHGVTTGLAVKIYKTYGDDAIHVVQENPLEADCLIVGEASMLDLLLTNNLLKAVDPAANVLFVVDVDQLPSVGAGDVLRDIIGSGRAAVVQLTTVFRRASDSGIVVNAHRINRGQVPILNKFEDFYFSSQKDPEEAADLLVDIVQRRIPQKFGLEPVNELQVLAPMYRGACGVANLNTRL